jgi:hypothetical protein
MCGDCRRLDALCEKSRVADAASERVLRELRWRFRC